MSPILLRDLFGTLIEVCELHLVSVGLGDQRFELLCPLFLTSSNFSATFVWMFATVTSSVRTAACNASMATALLGGWRENKTRL